MKTFLFHQNPHNKNLHNNKPSWPRNASTFSWYYLIKTLWSYFMDGVQLPQGYRQFKEAVYFLPFSSQTFLVLIFSFINLRRKKGRVNLGATLWFLNARPLDWESSALTNIRPLLIGQFQKKQGGWGHTFLKKNLLFFIFVLHPGDSRQNIAPPLEIPQNCIRSHGNSKPKNEDSWKFHIIFSWSPLEIPLRF